MYVLGSAAWRLDDNGSSSHCSPDGAVWSPRRVATAATHDGVSEQPADPPFVSGTFSGRVEPSSRANGLR